MNRRSFVLMHIRACLLTANGLLAISCGGQPDGGGGSVSFTISSSWAPANASTTTSYERSVSVSQMSCATTSIGPCTLNPCYGVVGSSNVPDVGQVVFRGGEMGSLAVDPSSTGSYMPYLVDGELPWRAGGELVTVAWAYTPGDVALSGGTLTLAAPPYVTLLEGSTFADASPTLARTDDVTIAWTSDSAPGPLDQVMVNVETGTTQVVCGFSASAGSGVIPSLVLQSLDSGTGKYNVHSKEYATQNATGADGAPWKVSFNVDANARTSTGLASGAVTVQ